MPKKSKPLPVCVPALLFGFLNLVSLYTQMCKPGKKVGWEKQYCMGRDREGGALPTVSCLGQALKLPSSMTCPDTTWEVHGGFSFSLQYKFPAGSGSFFFLTGPWLQQPLSACFPEGIPGLSASCSTRPDPSAQGKSWWSTGLQQNDVPACSSAGRSRAEVVSALTNVVSVFIRPISAACGIWLLWLDRFQVFFHVIKQSRWELEIFERYANNCSIKALPVLQKIY